jgi:hypothetical protein
MHSMKTHILSKGMGRGGTRALEKEGLRVCTRTETFVLPIQ